MAKDSSPERPPGKRPVKGQAHPKAKSRPKGRPRSRREQRRRQRYLLMAVLFVVVNVAGFFLTDSWAMRAAVLIVSAIAVPVAVWLLWDPEGRTGL